MGTRLSSAQRAGAGLHIGWKSVTSVSTSVRFRVGWRAKNSQKAGVITRDIFRFDGMQKVLVVRLRDEVWNGNLVESRSPAEVSVAGRKSQLAIADRLY